MTTVFAHARTELLRMTLEAVRSRLAGYDHVIAAQGSNGTVLLRFDGATLALVQPRINDYKHWQEETRHAVEDLVGDMKNRPAGTQGVVFLPRNARIRRSPSGAAAMGRRGITYQVDSGGERDQLANALVFIQRWRSRAANSEAHMNDFANALWAEPQEGF